MRLRRSPDSRRGPRDRRGLQLRRRIGDAWDHIDRALTIVAILAFGGMTLKYLDQQHVNSRQAASNRATAQALGRDAAALKATAVRQAEFSQSLVQGCNRLNQVRRSDNVAHYGNYILFQAVILTARHRTLTGAQTAFLVKLRRAAAAQSWTPITDCRRVIERSGVAYRLPPPIPFETRLPPLSALGTPNPLTG